MHSWYRTTDPLCTTKIYGKSLTRVVKGAITLEILHIQFKLCPFPSSLKSMHLSRMRQLSGFSITTFRDTFIALL